MAYFSEGDLLSDHARLRELAREVGVSDAGSLWESDAFTDEVRSDEAEAQELGISGVPGNAYGLKVPGDWRPGF